MTASQRDIAVDAMAKALYRHTAEFDGVPWEDLAEEDKAPWRKHVESAISAAEANDYRFERDLGTADWREGDGYTYILMTPTQRGEATGVVENILSSMIGSEARAANKEAKPPSPEGYRAVLEDDLRARGWAILPMGPLAFERAAEIADEAEAQQERDHGAANTGGAAAAAAAIREAVAKYYAPEREQAA